MCAIMGFSTKKLDKDEIREYFDRTISRGPDMSRIMDTGSGWLCFHRLAIMGLTEAGMQPFELDGDRVKNVHFVGGCDGNLKAVAKLVDGMTVEQIETMLRGNTCGPRPTSCADQLAIAVQEAYDKAQTGE